MKDQLEFLQLQILTATTFQRASVPYFLKKKNNSNNSNNSKKSEKMVCSPFQHDLDIIICSHLPSNLFCDMVQQSIDAGVKQRAPQLLDTSWGLKDIAEGSRCLCEEP